MAYRMEEQSIKQRAKGRDGRTAPSALRPSGGKM